MEETHTVDVPVTRSESRRRGVTRGLSFNRLMAPVGSATVSRSRSTAGENNPRAPARRPASLIDESAVRRHRRGGGGGLCGLGSLWDSLFGRDERSRGGRSGGGGGSRRDGTGGGAGRGDVTGGGGGIEDNQTTPGAVQPQPSPRVPRHDDDAATEGGNDGVAAPAHSD